MKQIIDIDDEEYNECIERNEWDTLSLGVKLIKAVQNGTPLLEELENIKEEIQSIIALADSRGEDTKLAYQCQIVINERISELKENNTQKEPDDFHEYWDEIAISELKG